MDRFKQIGQKLLDVWNKYTVKQRAVIVSSVAVVIIALVILAVVVNRPQYETLTTCGDIITPSFTNIGNIRGYEPRIMEIVLQKERAISVS